MYLVVAWEDWSTVVVENNQQCDRLFENRFSFAVVRPVCPSVDMSPYIVESFSTQRDGGKPKEGNRESPQIERERWVALRIKTKKKLRLQLQVSIVKYICHYWDKHCHYWDNQFVWAFSRCVENDSLVSREELIIFRSRNSREIIPLASEWTLRSLVF